MYKQHNFKFTVVDRLFQADIFFDIAALISDDIVVLLYSVVFVFTRLLNNNLPNTFISDQHDLFTACNLTAINWPMQTHGNAILYVR